jgi:hypothetical protein
MSIMTNRAKLQIIKLLFLVVLLSGAEALLRANPAEPSPIRGALIIVDFTETGKNNFPGTFFPKKQ